MIYCKSWECSWHNQRVAECDKQDIHIDGGVCEDYDAEYEVTE